VKLLRCAIYTRKSTEHGLDQEFNSLDNQREAAEAYIKSQAHEGWRLRAGGCCRRPTTMVGFRAALSTALRCSSSSLRCGPGVST
jgi:hypothetical protein